MSVRNSKELIQLICNASQLQGERRIELENRLKSFTEEQLLSALTGILNDEQEKALLKDYKLSNGASIFNNCVELLPEEQKNHEFSLWGNVFDVNTDYTSWSFDQLIPSFLKPTLDLLQINEYEQKAIERLGSILNDTQEALKEADKDAGVISDFVDRWHNRIDDVPGVELNEYSIKVPLSAICIDKLFEFIHYIDDNLF